MKIRKTVCLAIGGFAILTLLLVFVCNYKVVTNAEGKIYENTGSIRPAEVGLLLGTTPQTRIRGLQNMCFRYRIDATVELYNAGKINYILISGDENSLNGINEPQCMKDSLIARGIPSENIFLDGKGFRTLDSVVRMRKVYGMRVFTIISQRLHNERALYLAEHMELDVEDLKAFNAKTPPSALSLLTYVRECFARVKMFLDIIMGKQPTNLEDGEHLYNMIYKPKFEIGVFLRSMNTIDAHNEQDTIIGNFTGKGVDTLYVECVENPQYNPLDNDSYEQRFMYFLASPNKNIPRVKLYGCDPVSPKLVNEGDLDDNGTCEVGYLHTWLISQWRYYRIFTLVGKEWRYLVAGDYLETPEWFRHAGVEVAEPGKQKGTVLIHHYFDEYDVVKEEQIVGIRDTIVKPSFSIIDD